MWNPHDYFVLRQGSYKLPSLFDVLLDVLAVDTETRDRALELLRDPALFFKLSKVFEFGFLVPKINRVRFVVGEERNKRVAPILIGVSVKLDLASIIRYSLLQLCCRPPLDISIYEPVY